MGKHISAEIDSSFQRKLVVENALVAAAKSEMGDELRDRDKASLNEIIGLFTAIIQGEEQIRSPSLSAVSIDAARITNNIGGIYNTRLRFSEFIKFIIELKQTAIDMIECRKISKEKRQGFEEFLNLLSEFEGKEIERLQSQPIGSFSVA